MGCVTRAPFSAPAPEGFAYDFRHGTHGACGRHRGCPRRGPASLTAREIAEALPADEWRTVAKATVYPHAQRRLAVTVSTNTSPEVFRYIEDEDYSARSKFAEELLEIIGEDLSANDEMALIRALGKRLTAWQARRGSCAQHGCPDDPVRECLEEVLREHVGAPGGDHMGTRAPTPSSPTELETLDSAGLAAILHCSVNTIKSNASRSPEKLPPAIRTGGRRLIWLRDDVLAWLEAHRAGTVPAAR